MGHYDEAYSFESEKKQKLEIDRWKNEIKKRIDNMDHSDLKFLNDITKDYNFQDVKSLFSLMDRGLS